MPGTGGVFLLYPEMIP